MKRSFTYGVYRIRHPYGRWIQVPPSPLTPHPIFMYATTTIRHVVRARKWHAPLHTLEGVGSKRNTINVFKMGETNVPYMLQVQT